MPLPERSLRQLPLQDQAAGILGRLRAGNERLAPYERRALEVASGLSTAIVALELYSLTHESLWAGIAAGAYGLTERYVLPALIGRRAQDSLSVSPAESNIKRASKVNEYDLHVWYRDTSDGFTITLDNENGVESADVIDALGENRDQLRDLWKAASPEGQASDQYEQVQVKALRLPFGDGNSLVVLYGANGKNAYIHEKKLIYSSKEDEKLSFTGLAEFLSSKEGNNIEFDHGKPANIGTFGTINSNLKGSTAPDWMGMTAARINELTFGSVTVSNPNTYTNVKHNSGLDMSQFAHEANNLFGADVVVMNFEQKGGGISLAELRLAMLGSLFTGHKLIVRIEEPDITEDLSNPTAMNVFRSRAIAMAEIEFFQQKFGSALNMEYYPPERPLTLDGLADKALDAYKEGFGTIRPTISGPLVSTPHKYTVLSGSSSNARDMAIRAELKEQMGQVGQHMDADTYISDYDGPANLTPQERLEFIKGQRRSELEEMSKASDNTVYIGKGSLSHFAQMSTALLFAAYNGSNIHVLFGLDPRDEYDWATDSTEKARLLMNDELARELRTMGALTNYLQGIAPQLIGNIRSITDSMDVLISNLVS